MPDFSTLKTFDDVASLLTTNDKTLAADQAAVTQANAKVATDVQAQSDGQGFAAAVLATLGNVTVDNGDGTLTTYLPTTAAPGFRTESSKKSTVGLPVMAPPDPANPPASGS